jgi:hypothetical protein
MMGEDKYDPSPKQQLELLTLRKRTKISKDNIKYFCIAFFTSSIFLFISICNFNPVAQHKNFNSEKATVHFNA